MHICLAYNVRIYNTYMTLIGVHEMHDRVHPNQCHVTDLFVRDPISSSGYPMIIYTHPIADNLPVKTLVAR